MKRLFLEIVVEQDGVGITQVEGLDLQPPRVYRVYQDGSVDGFGPDVTVYVHGEREVQHCIRCGISQDDPAPWHGA